MHTPAPITAEYLPTGQLVHAVLPTLLVNLPASHLVHMVEKAAVE
jgi:hypothetical protein